MRQHFDSGAAWWPVGTVKMRGRERVVVDGAAIVAAYRAQMAGKKSVGESSLSENVIKLKAANEAEKLKQAQMQTRAMQRAEAIAEGNILPRDEYTLFIRECIGLARDQLANLPKRLAALASKKDRAKMRDEGERIVRGILDQLAAALETGPQRE